MSGHFNFLVMSTAYPFLNGNRMLKFFILAVITLFVLYYHTTPVFTIITDSNKIEQIVEISKVEMKFDSRLLKLREGCSEVCDLDRKEEIPFFSPRL